MILRTIGFAGIALFLGACASQTFEGKYDFYKGWRKGRITRIQPTSEVKVWKCMRPAAGSSQWAIVRHLNSGEITYVAVPLAPSDPFKTGDFVYVNRIDCALAVRTQVDVK